MSEVIEILEGGTVPENQTVIDRVSDQEGSGLEGEMECADGGEELEIGRRDKELC